MTEQEFLALEPYTSGEWAVISNAWKTFDKSTAFGCALRGGLFDVIQCRVAWSQYVATLDSIAALKAKGVIS